MTPAKRSEQTRLRFFSSWKSKRNFSHLWLIKREKKREMLHRRANFTVFHQPGLRPKSSNNETCLDSYVTSHLSTLKDVLMELEWPVTAWICNQSPWMPLGLLAWMSLGQPAGSAAKTKLAPDQAGCERTCWGGKGKQTIAQQPPPPPPHTHF